MGMVNQGVYHALFLVETIGLVRQPGSCLTNQRFRNEEPRSKLQARLLAGIFGGEEIDYTGRVHTPIQKSGDNFSVVVNFPEQARKRSLRRGMDPAFQSTTPP
jgi:hypothetical protein